MSTTGTLFLIINHQNNPLKNMAPGAVAGYLLRLPDRDESNQADIKTTGARVA